VTTSHLKSFKRAFPFRELFKKASRSAIIYSSLGSIALVLFLFNLYVIVDLLDTYGRLDLSGTDRSELSGYLELGEEITLDRQEDCGLLPTVWRTRNDFWGMPIRALYRQTELLHRNTSALVFLVGVAVGIGFLRSVLLSRARRCSTSVALDVVSRLRRALHRQALRLGPGDFEEQQHAHVLSLFTDDVSKIRDSVSSMVYGLGRYPFELLVLVIVSFAVHWWLAFECLLPLAACWYLVTRERQRSEAARRLDEDRADARLRMLAESLSKTRIVRGYGMEAFEHEQFQTYLERFCADVSKVKKGERWSRWVCRLLVTFSVAIVLFLVGSKVVQAPYDLSLSSAILLLVTFACMHQPLEALRKLHDDNQDASVTADRVYRYLDRIPDVSQAVGAKFLQPLSKSIQFEAVTFSLANKKQLLSGIDLKLRAGSVAAIVSTDPLEARVLAHLMPRFIEPQSGRILIDGEDIAWVTLESLRTETAYVGGSDPCFTGTVLDNIRCGNADYTLQDVTEAAKKTHAHSFIVKLSQGYGMVLGEHGEQLDAGQGFRLSLARAVLRNPALMIIEEPTSELNEDTKSLLEDAYNRISVNRTIIFLPSRLSTVRRANTVIFLHQGKVNMFGSYADLVKKSQLYRHWEYMRFNEFRNQMSPPE